MVSCLPQVRLKLIKSILDFSLSLIALWCARRQFFFLAGYFSAHTCTDLKEWAGLLAHTVCVIQLAVCLIKLKRLHLGFGKSCWFLYSCFMFSLLLLLCWSGFLRLGSLLLHPNINTWVKDEIKLVGRPAVLLIDYISVCYSLACSARSDYSGRWSLWCWKYWENETKRCCH